MLQWIHIQNYVLIQELEIDFQKGLTILTGETGAGKSILLGALSLLTGVRAESDSLLSPDKKCLVEASFQVPDGFLKPLLESLDIDYENQIILRREILPSGKSRAFINDTPVNLMQLKSAGSQLIDIHSQHQTLLLADADFRLMILDEQAQHLESVQELRTKFGELQQLKQEFQAIQAENRRLQAEQEFMQFQYDTLAKLPFRKAEDQDVMEQERDELLHAGDIQNAYQESIQLLENESFSVIGNLAKAMHQLQQISPFAPLAAELKARLDSSRIELSDIQREMEKKASQIEINPHRLAELEGNLDQLYQQLHKHRVSHLSDLLEIKQTLEIQLSSIQQADEREHSLKFEIAVKQLALNQMADALSQSRLQIIPAIETEVTDRLIMLGIKQARFQIHLQSLPTVGPTGKDEAHFLFTATPLHEPQEVSKVASGGELSRIMLSLKALLSHRGYKPCLVFDEIDTGVSGEIAHRTGKIIHEISTRSQVISITHLPQVAALGDYHYRVFKSEDGKSTHIIRLNDEERREEIARLLSGEDLNDSAREHAGNLLKK